MKYRDILISVFLYQGLKRDQSVADTSKKSNQKKRKNTPKKKRGAFEKKVQEICDIINKSSNDVLSLFPEERYAAIIGALYFNLALNICSKTLGIDETHRMLSLTEQSLNNYLISNEEEQISRTIH
ncbi:MAG: hypothetical protein F9K49_02285 [Caedimonadaceae bacterium]|nr:MAG: hypothetical protein F9K49_02285 [Caedimonadaceae bacterium]